LGNLSASRTTKGICRGFSERGETLGILRAGDVLFEFLWKMRGQSFAEVCKDPSHLGSYRFVQALQYGSASQACNLELEKGLENMERGLKKACGEILNILNTTLNI
jgi:hypothetical protein